MNVKDLGYAIVKYGAPILGTVVAGSAGNAIGQLVANAFGGDINDIDGLINKIVADPDSRTKLAEIQSNQKIELERLIVLSEQNRLQSENEKMKLAVDNTKDARANNNIAKTYFPQFLSVMIVAGFFAVLYWIAAFPQDDNDRNVLYLLTGVLGTAFGAVVNYWLGSSADKNYSLQPDKGK